MREHKFKHSFQDILNPFFVWPWCWNKYIFFSLLLLVANQRRTLLSTANDIDSSLANTNDSILTHILLLGQASLDISANTLILNSTTKYINERISRKSFLVFCNFLLHFHLFNFFPYSYYVLVLRFAFIYLSTLFFLHSLFGYTQVSFEY